MSHRLTGRAMVAAVATEGIEQQDNPVAFLVARMRDRPWSGRRCTGISSDALAIHAVGYPEPHRGCYPADLSDLAACERTYLMAPDDLRARMLPALEKYRAHVEAAWAKRETA